MPRARVERADGGDGRGQDRARPRAGSAARRQATVRDRPPGRRGGVRRGGVRAAGRAARRPRGPPGRGRGGARARPPRERGGPDARVPGRPQRDGGRPAGRGRRAALVLRPARAPQAHAGVGAAGDPGRVRGARPGGPPRRLPARRTAASGRSPHAWRSCGSAPARATASWTCSSGSSRRSIAPSRSEDEERELEAERGRLRHVEALRGARPPAAPGRWTAARRRRRGAGARGGAPRRWRRPAGWTRSWTRSAPAPARWRSRPRICCTSCTATPRASRRRPAASTRSRSGWRCWTGSSASTAARSRPCSPTPSTCRDAARRAGRRRGGDRGRRGRAGDGPRRARRARRRLTAAREAAGVALAEAVRDRLAALAMEGAEFTAARRRRATSGPRAPTRWSS